MSLNSTASSQRVQIGFFGLRNSGKSSLVNAITGQKLSVVSNMKGTTTDPVKKAMEILPIGPVVIVDTPGFDDEGELGKLRVEKTKEVLRRTDVAVLVTDISRPLMDGEKELISIFQEKNVPYIIARNKLDLVSEYEDNCDNSIAVSALSGAGVKELKAALGKIGKETETQKHIVSDLVEKGNTVVLVIPIDESAQKGRIILPQQQTLRELLDSECIVSLCQPDQLEQLLSQAMEKPKLVITDSQAFGEVSKIVPEDIDLVSFSILFARYKGELEAFLGGASKLKNLKDGDKVLISEGCTHHRQCKDIGTVKLPRWIEEYSGAKLDFVFTSGMEFPDDLEDFALCLHCGGCMLNSKEVEYRTRCCVQSGLPLLNYGIAIAAMKGILERSLKCFDDK